MTDDAFHGNAGVLVDISPKMHQYVPHYEKKDWVHITPIPDAYRPAEAVASEVGEAANYNSPEEYEFQVASKCADEVDKMFRRVTQSRQGVAAFICEPCFVSIIHDTIFGSDLHFKIGYGVASGLTQIFPDAESFVMQFRRHVLGICERSLYLNLQFFLRISFFWEFSRNFCTTITHAEQEEGYSPAKDRESIAYIYVNSKDESRDILSI